jgi:hypothetical protein
MDFLVFVIILPIEALWLLTLGVLMWRLAGARQGWRQRRHGSRGWGVNLRLPGGGVPLLPASTTRSSPPTSGCSAWPAYSAGQQASPVQVTTPGGRIVGQLVTIAVLTVPVTLWFAWWEAAPPGKRLLGLRVSRLDGSGLPWPDSLLRSLAKIALPWELAHTGVWNSLAWPGGAGELRAVHIGERHTRAEPDRAVRGCPQAPVRPCGWHGRAARR